MFDLAAYFTALGALAVMALLAWVYSVARHNVSIVDSLWSLKFLLAAAVYAALAPSLSQRALLVLALVGVWALRLAGQKLPIKVKFVRREADLFES